MEEKLRTYKKLADNALHALDLQSAIFTFYINSNPSKDKDSERALLDEIERTRKNCQKWRKELEDVNKEESFTLPHTWQVTFTPEKNLLDEI